MRKQICLLTLVLLIISGCASYPQKDTKYSRVHSKTEASSNLAKGILSVVGSALLTSLAAGAIISRASAGEEVLTGGWDFALGIIAFSMISAGTTNVYRCFNAKYEWEEILEKPKETRKASDTLLRRYVENDYSIIQVRHRLSEGID